MYLSVLLAYKVLTRLAIFIYFTVIDLITVFIYVYM